jgi:hypothetical protein
VRLEAVAVEETHVVAGEDGDRAPARRMQREGVEGVFALAPGAGELQVQVLAEAALQVGQMLLGQLVAAARGQTRGMALAPGDGEQAPQLPCSQARSMATPSVRWPPSRRG